ncbi:Hint domain-containing protein [Sedimentitalea todarodis]|uniref:Hint domain-containing protein n=1 Tax=Sedimentitalea todarodis TaxID=1631240 RepID=A0ABU3VC87_9RHOB|nr:Hint domain-containing protein [Sedimentitalea todarodis]MDU9003688.1 Hint domain-containing protein [Sedimentitalea todarodis]
MHISTPTGDVCLTELRVGNRVITRDHGVQTVNWVGRRDLSAAEIDREPHLGPVRISAGALGQGLPMQDLLLSPHTRVLVKSDDTALYLEDDALLVSAKNLIGLEGIDHAENAAVTYVHISFEQHEVVRADGVWIERFQPADPHVYGIREAQRAEMYALFPELTETPAASVPIEQMAGSVG